MKPIRKAVFPVAGLGTRFLSATKAMPKKLQPIVDKPLIQYAARSVAGLLEKPDFEKVPSNLASIGRFVLTPYIFEILRGQAPSADGEIQLADAFNAQAAARQVGAVTLYGLRFDCG